MDNLTHSLVGLLLARTGLARPIPYGTALAVAAANCPDIDVTAGIAGSLCYLAQHRGFTHSLLWLPVVAAAPLPFWWLLARRKAQIAAPQWLRAGLVSFLAAATHPLLDALNVYGIRIFAPASGRWFHADLVNIVDVWIWALLLLCTLGPLLARLVYGEIGARGASGRGMAWLALFALPAFIAFRAMLHQQALDTLSARIYGHQQPIRVLATPSAANPWLWTGLVETRSFWRVVPVDLHREFDPDAGATLHQPDIQHLRPVIAASRTGRVFLDFSQAQSWAVLPAARPEGALEVTVTDLRFGPPPGNPFTARFLLDQQGRLLSERFDFAPGARPHP